jgi:hypothetical protein
MGRRSRRSWQRRDRFGVDSLVMHPITLGTLGPTLPQRDLINTLAR